MFVWVRCLVVWSTATAVALAAAYAGGDAVAAGVSTGRVDGAVTAVAGGALVGCVVWAWLVCTAVVATAVRTTGAPRRLPGVPAWAARALLAACGVAVLAAAPAHAGEAGGPPPPAAGSSLDGLPFPDRPVGPAADRRTPQLPPAGSPDRVVVRPGDSLWAIAEAALGRGATDAEVAAATAALYELNRSAVGGDPDLIHPGLRLRTPGS